MKKVLYILFLLSIAACNTNKDENPLPQGMDFRKEMRDLVIAISQYGKSLKPGFIIIPQNGQELVTQNGTQEGEVAIEYLNSIDGTGREDLLYGFDQDNEATTAAESEYMIAFLDICVQEGIKVLVTDYCSDHSKMDDSYSRNNSNNYISFAAPSRDLNVIPDYPQQPYQENSDGITSLQQAKNFLYLINPEHFVSKQAFIDQVSQTNYDVIIMDMFYNESAFEKTEINALKTKKNGGRRLVISYMSIGEAENYRYYWQNEWNSNKPSWLDEENPDWEGNFKVWYWDTNWQSIIYSNDNSYLKKIIDAGFDGVYLDIIDAFEYYEDKASD